MSANRFSPLMSARRSACTCVTVVVGLVWLVSAGSAAVAVTDEPAKFDSPDAAKAALCDACKSGEKGALNRIFGTSAGELLSGDDVQDKTDLAEFAKALLTTCTLVKNEKNGSMTLTVGKHGYPFPIPLVQAGGKWYFDTAAGKEELLNRRVGENELSTIAVCRAYGVAQREYAQADRDGDDVIEYAQRIASTPGKKDGLFWEAAAGEPPSPLGPLVAQARAEGYLPSTDPSSTKPRPYHGYIFKVLTKQAASAPGGKFDYVVNGHMVAGFALVASPVEYGRSGVVTFLMNSNGKIFQKDLGEKTSELVSAIDSYDVDSTWESVKD